MTRAAATVPDPTPAGRPFDEAVGQGGQGQGGQGGPGDVDGSVGIGIAGLGHVAGGQEQDHSAQGHVDEEDPAPRRRGDQVAAEQRSGRGGHATQPRPCADGLTAVVAGERRLQDGQAPGRQQRPAHSLQQAGGDQLARTVGDGAGGRGDGEPRHPDHEDPPPPVPVAEGAAEQEQGGEGERVPGHHPLQRAQRGVEGAPDGGQGDADHRGVDGGHARAEHGGGDHPSARARAVPEAQASGGRGRVVGTTGHVGSVSHPGPVRVGSGRAPNCRCGGDGGRVASRSRPGVAGPPGGRPGPGP